MFSSFSLFFCTSTIAALISINVVGWVQCKCMCAVLDLYVSLFKCNTHYVRRWATKRGLSNTTSNMKRPKCASHVGLFLHAPCLLEILFFMHFILRLFRICVFFVVVLLLSRQRELSMSLEVTQIWGKDMLTWKGEMHHYFCLCTIFNHIRTPPTFATCATLMWECW